MKPASVLVALAGCFCLGLPSARAQQREDLLRWEGWLARTHGIKAVQVAGISYGGDLALTCPVFSARVERIFASGTFGSFAPIFERCYNAPAHTVPGVLLP